MFLCFVRACGYAHILNLRSDRQWSAVFNRPTLICVRVRFDSDQPTLPIHSNSSHTQQIAAHKIPFLFSLKIMTAEFKT